MTDVDAPGADDDAAFDAHLEQVIRRAARLVIAIDGPAGSGKSSVARAVADRLEVTYLDTGAIYRSITLACMRAGVDLEDADACAEVAARVRVTQVQRRTLLDGQDVEEEIRGDVVSANVSTVAAHEAVRLQLLEHQRAMAADGGIVEGRDIGTVVLPDAELKVFLTASAHARAERRAAQLDRPQDVEELREAIAARDELDSNRSVAPLRPAEDAWVLDTSDWEFDEVVDVVTTRILALAEDVLEGERLAPGPRRLPRVVVVGRPNVGKSTFVNRVLRERVTIVEAEPGVTRDRTEHVAHWQGRDFVLVDTGGWERDAAGEIASEVVAQTEAGIASADLVLQLVDGSVGVLDDDEAIARVLRRGGTPTVLAVNKLDRDLDVSRAGEYVRLGLGDPFAISARNGRGMEDLLDAVVAGIAHVAEGSALVAPQGTPQVAIVGRPNVGKSSLFNRLVGDDRSIVHDAPHTTRDAIDTRVELDGREWVFIDTAGLRRRYRSGEELETYAVDRTRAAIERADVTLFVVDASQPIGAQEQRLAALLRDAGCGLVIVCNKWDEVDEERREDLEKELDRLLSFAAWAPRVNVSALTGRGVSRLAPMLATVLENHRRRIATSELNQVIGRAVADHAPPRSGTRVVRIRYAVQVAVAPPQVLLFASGPVEETYRRYLERILRERYELTGVPLVIEERRRAPRERTRGRGGPRSGGAERGRRTR
jgi:GTP-binding protein